MAKSVIDWIAFVLVIIGGINWALYSFGINLVELVSFNIQIVANIIYWLVGIAALYLIYYLFKK
ncbi:MAG: DUF378 domain-containing protein [Candidatus Pacearchaeota archaeon]